MSEMPKLPSRIEVNSKGRRDAPYSDDLSQALNFYFETHAVFEECARLLSGFVNAVALPHVSLLRRKAGESGFWILFFNAHEDGTDAFYLHFTPNDEEKRKMPHGSGYISKGLAKGFLFKREITFFQPESTDPKFLVAALAAIAGVFKAQGWTVKERGW